MATNESDFKREFKKALAKFYGDKATIWTNNDMFRCGLPDFSAVYDSKFFAVEAKFVKAPPVRDTSKVLSHELTPIQAEFLSKVQKTGGHAVVLIGFPDIAVAVPFSKWSSVDSIPETNITLQQVKFLRSTTGFVKRQTGWAVESFFERCVNG